MSEYQVVLLFDAHKIIDVNAKTPENALEIAENEHGQMTLCYECARQMEMGDCNGAFVYSRNDKKVLDTSSAGVLESQLAALKEENAQLKARMAELEKEDTLWAMLDAIEKALFKKAAPHAWESVVTSAGMEFITSRRKTKEPANEG